MYLEITMQQLLGYISEAVDVGIQTHVKALNPNKDKIKRKDAVAYLVNHGYDIGILNAWESNGLITPYMRSDAKSASKWYSLSDIKKLMLTVKVKILCNNNG